MRKISVVIGLVLAIVAAASVAQVTRGPINQQGTVTAGHVAVFAANNILKDGGASTSSLTSAHIFVGNAMNVATDVAMSGNVTIDNTGVTTIANSAVTYARIQNISATQRVLGRNTAGAGVTEEVTASQVLDWIGSTRGSLLYRGATGWAILSPGTSGDVLTSNGAGADPSYQAGGGGGYTDEQAQDAVGTILNTEDFVYSDGTPSIRLASPHEAPFTTPVDGDFAWINQGGASTTVNANGGIFLRAPTSAGDNARIRKKAAPGSTPYTITAAVQCAVLNVNFQTCGIVLRQSSDGKLVAYEVEADSGKTVFQVGKYNSPTSANSQTTIASVAGPGTVIWLRLTDNGTNRIFYYSVDGYNFIQLHSEGRTTFLTADEVGFIVNDNNATYEAGLTLLSWKQTFFLPFFMLRRRRRAANDNEKRAAA